MRLLVIGGSPQPSSAGLVSSLAMTCNAVVAIDRGFDYALAAGVEPDLFCGDADTISERGKLVLSESGCDKAFYNPHKDDTDLGLALSEIAERWPESDLIGICLSGGRPDHALGVVGRLANFEGGRVGLREDAFTARFLHAGESWSIYAPEGTAFSMLPLSEKAVVSESGFEWNLDHAEVPLLSDLGISNVVRNEEASITCHNGIVVGYLFCE